MMRFCTVCANHAWEGCEHLADGFLHLVEVRGLVEVAGHHLGQQRGQHVGKREQD